MTKREMPDLSEMVTNILDIFEVATDKEYTNGMYWYSNAHAICWGLDHLNPKRAAGVIAALSPLTSWTKNVEHARMVYAGAEYIPTLQKNAAKAILIRDGWEPLEILKGQKVTAFYRNIINPNSENPLDVTVDKHAYDIAMGISHEDNVSYRNASMTPSEYAFIGSAYVAAARQTGILPLQMQAVTWETWRNLKKNK